MKLKNKDILNFVNGCASLREKRLPVKLGYAIKKNLAAVSDAANAYDAEHQELSILTFCCVFLKQFLALCIIGIGCITNCCQVLLDRIAKLYWQPLLP